MRILFVAMTESVHTVRWVSQFADLGWGVDLFPSFGMDVQSEFRNVTVHGFTGVRPAALHRSVNVPGAWGWPFSRSARRVDQLLRHARRFRAARRGGAFMDTARRLAAVIATTRPHIVHSLETQHAGYLTLEAKRRLGESFPPWIVTPWGSDIYLYGRLAEHEQRIRDVLAACDYYGPKSQRDIVLGREFGFAGELLPIFPGNGGIDTAALRRRWQPGPTSNRRTIIVKGYQGMLGRALVALRAVELCADALKDYRVLVYFASHDVRVKAELIARETGLRIECLPVVSHDEMLTLYGRARVSLGASLSDGVPNSLLEAMTMAAFPIESDSSCAGEWVRNGETGFIVPPEESHAIADALREAVTDDSMVDRAADTNARVARERLDKSVITPEAIATYEKIAVHGLRASRR